MTVVKPTTQIKPNGSRSAPVFSGPTDKEIADLQVKKATLLNDIGSLTLQFNDLASQKSKLVKEIDSEMALYNGMILKTTAEMEQELADLKSTKLSAEIQKTNIEISEKLKKHQLAVDQLQQVFNNIESRRLVKVKELSDIEEKIGQKTAEHESLLAPLESLKKQISDHELVKIKSNDELEKIINQQELLKSQFNSELVKLHNEVNGFQVKIKEADDQLKAVLVDVDKAKDQEVQARENAEAYRVSQQDFLNFLKRKERDLQIWEKRLMPAFKEKYPNGEMKFI